MNDNGSMTALEAYQLISRTHTRRGENVDEAFGILFKAAERAAERPMTELAASAVSDDEWRTPYSTAADYATFAAALMNAGGGMEDTEAKADGGALVIEVHQVPVWRATFVCSVPGCTQCQSHKFLGYTDAQLRAAWSLVPKDAADWKRPIRGFVPAGTDTDAMSAAIAHYCGSPAEFRPQPDGSIEVTASGYHACIGS